MEIKVGDLIRIRGEDWIAKPLGIVTETKRLTHERSGEQYTAVTALVEGKYFTFGDEAFELISADTAQDRLAGIREVGIEKIVGERPHGERCQVGTGP